MSEAFEDIPADVGTGVTFMTSPSDDTFMSADVSFAAPSPPVRPESPELPALPITHKEVSAPQTEDSEVDLTGIHEHADEPALLEQPNELQIAISPVINEFKKPEESETWHSEFAAFQESKEATPVSDFGEFATVSAIATPSSPAPASAGAPANLTVKADEWSGDFHASPPVSPHALSLADALKHVQANDIKKLHSLFKGTFPGEKSVPEMNNALPDEPNLDELMKKTFAGLPEIAQNLSTHCSNGADVLKIYEKDFFKWDQSFVETYMFRSMGIAYPSERVTTSVFETRTSMLHRTSLIAFHQDNIAELKDFDDKSELPDFKSNANVNQESLGVDANPLDLKENFVSVSKAIPSMVKMSSMDLLQEAIDDYAVESNRRTTEARLEEEEKLKELLYGTSSNLG
jgi:hypothetical protein